MLLSRRMFSRWVFPALFMVLVPWSVSGQQILTAIEFFDSVARNYAELTDYIATMTWTDESGSMRGTIYYKKPNLIRINFDAPAEQVLVSNGQEFIIYVPAFNVILKQDLRSVPGQSPGALATAEGLTLMRRNFSVAYLEGPEPVPLGGEPDVFVTQLRLDRKQVTEGFRQIVLSVDETSFIRRIVGTKVDWEEVQLDLTDIQINQNIPNARFDYSTEKDSSTYENFLFSPEG